MEQAGKDPALPPRLQRAVRALLDHATIKEAAESIGVGETTVHAWLKNNEQFSVAVHAASRGIVTQSVTRLRGMTGKAVKTLDAGMDGAASKVQVQAAGKVLDFVAKLDDRDRQMDAVQNLGVRMLMFYAALVEQHVQDPIAIAAIRRDFLALGLPLGEQAA